MTDEKRERLNALSGKMKEHAETSSERSRETAGTDRSSAQRLAPGSTGTKPTAASSNASTRPTGSAASVKPSTGTASVKPTGSAASVKPSTGTASVRPAASFKDVPANAYYADAVKWAVQQGITSGTTETTFTPDNPCHRGHAATFLWRFMGQPKARSSRNPFQDVSDGPFYQAILWASGANIIPGTSPSTFEYTAPCTRRQVLAFLMRAQDSAGATEDQAVKWAAHKGLMTSMTGGVDAVCTRADIITFLYRLRNR